MGDDVEMVRGKVLGPTGSTVSITFQRPVGQEREHHKPSGEGSACQVQARRHRCEPATSCHFLADVTRPSQHAEIVLSVLCDKRHGEKQMKSKSDCREEKCYNLMRIIDQEGLAARS